jgi:hypothetical protein
MDGVQLSQGVDQLRVDGVPLGGEHPDPLVEGPPFSALTLGHMACLSRPGSAAHYAITVSNICTNRQAVRREIFSVTPPCGALLAARPACEQVSGRNLSSRRGCERRADLASTVRGQRFKPNAESAGWGEELQRDVVGVAERETGPEVGVDDSAVGNPHAVQPLDPLLEF